LINLDLKIRVSYNNETENSGLADEILKTPLFQGVPAIPFAKPL